MTRFSILDLCPIVEGGSPRQSLGNSLDLARHAERWGYHRYWVAEHHNIPGIASAATAVVICHLAAGTSTIRVGAGGIMLPNHAPLVVAEQFGTLEALYPGRIDLGLGRAPGTDPVTTRALRRSLDADVDEFPNDVVELRGYLAEASDAARIRAVPGSGSNVPLWILGSSLYGAKLAAMLGLPYAFASHFAPAELDLALQTYRERFTPSPQLAAPYVMVGFNVFAADTHEHACYLRSSMAQSFLKLRQGQPGRLPPPVDDLESHLGAHERELVGHIAACSATGTADTVEEQIDALIERTAADEVILACNMFNHASRLRSFEITAGVYELGTVR